MALMTAQRKAEFEKEFAWSKDEGRREVVSKIQVARSFGDLSENSEYDIALLDQAKLESRIVELEQILKEAELYEIKDSYDCIAIGCVVAFEDIKTKKHRKVQIVGIYESNPDEDKISVECPLAKSLLGKKVGEIANFSHKQNLNRYKILSIEAPTIE